MEEHKLEDLLELFNEYDELDKDASKYNGADFGSNEMDSYDFSMAHEMMDLKEQIFEIISEFREPILVVLKKYPPYAKTYKRKFLLWCEIYDKEQLCLR